jgi:hypothetical protein
MKAFTAWRIWGEHRISSWQAQDGEYSTVHPKYKTGVLTTEQRPLVLWLNHLLNSDLWSSDLITPTVLNEVTKLPICDTVIFSFICHDTVPKRPVWDINWCFRLYISNNKTIFERPILTLGCTWQREKESDRRQYKEPYRTRHCYVTTRRTQFRGVTVKLILSEIRLTWPADLEQMRHLTKSLNV